MTQCPVGLPKRLGLVAALTVTLVPAVAHAHPPDAATGGLLDGLTHPLNGLDHLLAALGAGLWAARLGRGGLGLLLLAFPSAVALGCGAAFAGLTLPVVGLAAGISAAAVGALVALRRSDPALHWSGAALFGCIAFVQGAAHGSGLSSSADGAGYATGLAIATGLVQISGVGLAGMLRPEQVRWAGAALVLAAFGGALQVAPL